MGVGVNMLALCKCTIDTALALWREPPGRALKLNFAFQKNTYLSISAQGGLFPLAIQNITAASLLDFPNYRAGQR